MPRFFFFIFEIECKNKPFWPRIHWGWWRWWSCIILLLLLLVTIMIILFLLLHSLLLLLRLHLLLLLLAFRKSPKFRSSPAPLPLITRSSSTSSSSYINGVSCSQGFSGAILSHGIVLILPGAPLLFSLILIIRADRFPLSFCKCNDRGIDRSNIRARMEGTRARCIRCFQAQKLSRKKLADLKPPSLAQDSLLQSIKLWKTQGKQCLCLTKGWLKVIREEIMHDSKNLKILGICKRPKMAKNTQKFGKNGHLFKRMPEIDTCFSKNPSYIHSSKENC